MVGGERRIGGQLQIEEQGAEEEIAAQPLVQQHGVLAEPAQARPAGEIALQQRSRVHDAAAEAARRLLLQPVEQTIEAIAQDIVIIHPTGVTSDSTDWRAGLRERPECFPRALTQPRSPAGR